MCNYNKQVTERGGLSTCNIYLPSMFADDTVHPNYRPCHSKVILDIFQHQSEKILLKTIPQ